MAEQAFAAVPALSAAPGHPLNAGFLHELLATIAMPERDAFWAVRLHG